MHFVPEAIDLFGDEHVLKKLSKSINPNSNRDGYGFAALTRSVFTRSSKMVFTVAHVHYDEPTGLFHVNLRVTIMYQEQFSSFSKSSVLNPNKPIKTITTEPESTWQGERVYNLRGFTHQQILDFINTNFLKPLGSRDYNDCVVVQASDPDNKGLAPVCQDCPYQLSCCL